MFVSVGFLTDDLNKLIVASIHYTINYGVGVEANSKKKEVEKIKDQITEDEVDELHR
jgi:hypothetical protein